MRVLQTAGLYLYNLALGLGGFGLFALALADSSFLSIPEGNDVLIVVLSMGAGWSAMLYYVAMTVAGSVAGCTLLYWVGRRGGGFMKRRMNPEKLAWAEVMYSRWGLWAVLVPSVLPPPTPFKVFVFSAGLFQLPFPRFLTAVAVGRTIRYLMWGILAVLYGEWARRMLEENMQTVGIVLLGLFVLAAVTLLVLRSGKSSPTEAS